MNGWNPTNPDTWARLLGLVAVPMFNANRARELPGEHSLLLDGPAGSFVLSISDSQSSVTDSDANRWAWSANVAHHVFVEADSRYARMGRWDEPQAVERFRIARARDIRSLFESVENSQPPAEGKSVISRGLATFRAIRTAMEKRGGSDLDVILAFNTILALVAIHGDNTGRLQLDFAEAIRQTTRNTLAAPQISPQLTTYPIGDLARLLWEGTSGGSPYLLDADLLIRHASGQFYQEAHKQLVAPIRQEPQRELFPADMLLIGRPHRRMAPPSDVHSTPPSLARALVEMALHVLHLPPDETSIEVLDPACGSGVFLIEAVREAVVRGHASLALSIRGYDRSPLAAEMSSFCVRHATEGIGADRSIITINKRDSLKTQWGTPNIIVMNPPFVSWEDLDAAQRADVACVLGAFHRGRPDIAFAFIMRALDSLAPGGVLASIVPPSLFERESAELIRKFIVDSGDYQLRVIGHFKDFSYFNATVEPSFIVVSRTRKSPDVPIRVVTADAGHGERAIRGFRTAPWDRTRIESGYEIYNITASELSSRRWTPIPSELLKFARALTVNTNTVVGDLFAPQLGVRTGNKKVFLLTDDEFSRLCESASEKRFFRPVADRILHGRIQPAGYLFYPYDEQGNLLLSTEREVARAVPRFYRTRLKPAEQSLKERTRYRQWWELTRPVATWLAPRSPRIVSQTYGRAGNFAFDEDGRYAVVQGVGWQWRSGSVIKNVMFAYLAMLNSSVFDKLLAAFCPRVQGGQYDLTQQFIERVPLPGLGDSLTIAALSRIGRAVFHGRTWDSEEQDRLVLAAYGVSETGVPLVATRSVNVDREFRRLANEWQSETAIYSRISQKVAHPAYRKIIALGDGVIPILLREMRDSPSYWSAALTDLTGVDPVPDSANGLDDVANAWVQWGRNSGYDV